MNTDAHNNEQPQHPSLHPTRALTAMPELPWMMGKWDPRWSRYPLAGDTRAALARIRRTILAPDMTESTAPITVAGVSTESAAGAIGAGESADRRKPSIDRITARRARVTVTAVMVGVLLGVVGWQAMQFAHVRRIEQARASCAAANRGLDAAGTRLDRALAQARRMAGMDANSVADPATRTSSTG